MRQKPWGRESFCNKGLSQPSLLHPILPLGAARSSLLPLTDSKMTFQVPKP